MKPLVILLSVSAIALLVVKIALNVYNFPLAGRVGLSAMLLFTALGHFMFTNGMAMMVPAFLPFKKGLVYLTAVAEILGAVGIHIAPLRTISGWLLIAFLVLILPANIKASIKHLDFQKGTYDGKGPSYLWFRIPLQLFFIAWVYLSTIKFS